MARSIAITSGKGGVGKTNAATNIGVSLARMGRKVCIFDADLGLANVNVLTGQAPALTVEHLVDGTASIDEIVMEGPEGLHIVPSGSGVEKLSGLDPDKVASLRSGLEKLEADHDYLLIDTAAGIGPEVVGFIKAAHEALVVVSPEPTSLTDAYALIKVLNRQGYERDFSILVNMSASEEEARRTFGSLRGAAKKFLGRELKFAGFVPRDYALASSVARRTPVSILFPESTASQCFARIALAIDSGFGPNGTGGFSASWPNLLMKEPEAEKSAGPARRREEAPDLPELEGWLQNPEIDEEAARDALARAESAFIRRFGKPYADFKTGLFNQLDFSDVTPAALKEAAMLLESVHERRFGKPIFGVEDVMLKALSACDSELRMRNLVSTLESGFSRRFGSKPTPLEERLRAEAQDGTLTSARMKDIAAICADLHKRKYGEELRLEGSVSASDLTPLAEKIAESEKWAAELNAILEILDADREELKNRLEALSKGGKAAGK